MSCPKCGGKISGDGVNEPLLCETVNKKHFFQEAIPGKVWCTSALVINFHDYIERKTKERWTTKSPLDFFKR